MKVKIEDGGGYQGTTLVMDAVPRVGETVRIVDWEGEVAEVIHVALANGSGKRYRAEDEPAALLVLSGSRHISNR